MSQKLQTKWIADNAVTLAKIAAAARTGILAGKLIPARRGVLNFTAADSSSSSDVTTEITAAAANLIPRSSLTAGLGVYTGAITNGAADAKVVIVRLAGTNEGVDDGSNNEVYGILTEDTGTYTLSYKKSDGTDYTFPDDTAIDFYFVEVQDLSILSPDALLLGSVTGVVDATHAITLAAHLDGGPSKHDASEIDVEGTGTYYAPGTVEDALDTIDAQVATNTSGIAAVTDDVSHLVTLSGVTTDSNHLGTFTGSTIADSRTVKQALQDLETAVETKASSSTVSEIDGNVDDLITLSGVAENITDLGTFSGSTIPDSSTVKAALQSLETALEAVTTETHKAELFTLSGTDITNKYVDLAFVPKTATYVEMLVMGGLEQDYGVDYTVITNGSVIKRLTWDTGASGGPSTGMVGDLLAGDRIRVRYEV